VAHNQFGYLCASLGCAQYTDHATCVVCSNKLHLCMVWVMWPNNDNNLSIFKWKICSFLTAVILLQFIYRTKHLYVIFCFCYLWIFSICQFISNWKRSLHISSRLYWWSDIKYSFTSCGISVTGLQNIMVIDLRCHIIAILLSIDVTQLMTRNSCIVILLLMNVVAIFVLNSNNRFPSGVDCCTWETQSALYWDTKAS